MVHAFGMALRTNGTPGGWHLPIPIWWRPF